MSYTLNLKGKIYDLSDTPLVMGILNHTPDSFYSGSRIQGENAIHDRIKQIVEEGADIIDIGGYSTRPSAADVSADEEWKRVKEVLDILRTEYPHLPISVDTFRSEVARKAIEEGGADIINDVSGGLIDNEMLPTIAQLNVPYILMHMRGTPKTMQSLCEYEGRVSDGVIKELLPKIKYLREKGVKDIIIDPGFGFSKTTMQNYQLMRDLRKFSELELPLLVGISRKSMIYKLFDNSPTDALNGTTILNTYSLINGAHIIRVHDVREAVETVKITKLLKS